MNKYFIALTLSVFLIPGMIFAQDPIIYPAKGQDAQQTDKDKFDCYNWAKGQTGFDPMQPPKASSPPPAQAPQSGRGGSVLRGAAVGQQAQQDQWAQQEANNYSRQRDGYNRAFSACMEGRGYTVK